MMIYVDASRSEAAQRYYKQIAEHIKMCAIEDADVIVVLGGDGYMLTALHRINTQFNRAGKPRWRGAIYGINCGTVGFLMNALNYDDISDLVNRIKKATITKLHPLTLEATQTNGNQHTLIAINEVTLMRQTHQTCRLSIAINGVVRMNSLIGDGVIVATSAGSTAYNFSAHGPIIPLGIPLLALTPLNPFMPRHWRGAIIPNTAEIVIEVEDVTRRPVHVTADCTTIHDIRHVCIKEDTTTEFSLLFDADHNLEQRILNVQFANDMI